MVRYKYNRTNFKIDSVESAYIAGLIWADGHLSNDRCTILFQEADHEIVEMISQYFFGNNNYIRRYNCNGRCYLTLGLYKKSLREELSELGLCNNDNGRSLPLIPTNLLGHFTRGLLDGDGHASEKYQHISIAGRMTFLIQLMRQFVGLGFSIIGFTLVESAKSKKNKKKGYERYGSLSCKRYYQFDFVEFLYPNEMMNFYLTRKFIEVKYLKEKKDKILYYRNKYPQGILREEMLKGNSELNYAFPENTIKNMNPDEELEHHLDVIKDSCLKERYFKDVYNKITNELYMYVSLSSIERFVKRNEIPTIKKLEDELLESQEQKLIALRDNGKPKTEIAKAIGVSCKKLTRYIGTEEKVIYDTTYFDKIDDDKKAFLLGFLLARGTVYGRYFNIKLKRNYEWLLKDLMYSLCIKGGLKITSMGHKYVKLSIGHTTLVKTIQTIKLNNVKQLCSVLSARHLKSFVKGLLVTRMHYRQIKTGCNIRINGYQNNLELLIDFFAKHGIYGVDFVKGQKTRIALKKSQSQDLIKFMCFEFNSEGLISNCRYNEKSLMNLKHSSM